MLTNGAWNWYQISEKFRCEIHIFGPQCLLFIHGPASISWHWILLKNYTFIEKKSNRRNEKKKATVPYVLNNLLNTTRALNFKLRLLFTGNQNIAMPSVIEFRLFFIWSFVFIKIWMWLEIHHSKRIKRKTMEADIVK